MQRPLLSVPQFRDRLSRLLAENAGGAVVFDADGTLWSHDVGCMVFDWAVEHRLFGLEALEPLLEFGVRQNLRLVATESNQVALQLQEAFYGRQLDDHAAAVMQTWAYVGMAELDFRAMTRDALEGKRHLDTLHRPIVDLSHWVREIGGRALIVSASPQWVVEEAASFLGFSTDEIVAGKPNLDRSHLERGPRIAPGLAQPLPYGMEKVRAGRSLIGSTPWVAALGDSSFDLDMFREAKLAAGIGTKADMLRGLAEIEHAIVLTFS